ncbi:MAG TPA: hypothetical protein VEN81_03285, partial [Planctomycetota bacterium]|nr:hypothetical protein [Planctomycetota bacterium]
MKPPTLVRVLASVRVPSGHGPDVDYELVHAVVASAEDPDTTHESVFLRLVSGDTPRNDLVAEVLAGDLPSVNAEWTRFVSDVLRRRARAGDSQAQAALDRDRRAALPPAGAAEGSPVIVSASGGRFGV